MEQDIQNQEGKNLLKLTFPRQRSILTHELQQRLHPHCVLNLLIEELFTDSHIYKNDKFRQLIESNSKGYISLSQVLKMEKISNYIVQYKQEHPQNTDLFNPEEILRVINSQSKILIANKASIRRMNKFINKLTILKPVYVQGFDSEEIPNPSKLESILCNWSNIIKIRMEKQYAFVFAEQPQQLLKANGQNVGWKKKLTVQSYGQTARQIDSLSSTRSYVKIQSIYQDFKITKSKNSHLDIEFCEDEADYYGKIGKQQDQDKKIKPNYNANIVLKQLKIEFQKFISFT